MANPVLLNNQEHHAHKYQQRFGEAFGHKVGRMMVFPNEIHNLHVQYPLLFCKGQDGLQLIALLGFSADENLFLEGDDWQAHVTPLLVARGPFMIGFQSDATGQKAPVVHVDMDDARLSETEGDALFLEQGGAAPQLQRIQAILKNIDEGLQQTAGLVGLAQEYNLLEPMDLDIALADKSFRLEGYSGISLERLQSLADEQLVALSATGALPLLYWLAGSMANVSRLADLKQRRLQHG